MLGAILGSWTQASIEQGRHQYLERNRILPDIISSLFRHREVGCPPPAEPGTTLGMPAYERTTGIHLLLLFVSASNMLKLLTAFVLSVSVVAAAPLLIQEPSFTSGGSGVTTIGELAGVSHAEYVEAAVSTFTSSIWALLTQRIDAE
jgi:hypothetical protein